MNKLIAALVAVAAFAAFLPLALAQASAPVVPDDLAGLVSFFKETHDSKAWGLLIGGIITVLVRLLTLLKPLAAKLPPEATKWLAMALAMLTSVSTGLLAGVAWYKVIVDGLTVGVAAMGGWEFVLKPILAKLGLSTNPVGSVKAPS